MELKWTTIIWRDANSDSGWQGETPLPLGLIASKGWIVAEDDNKVCLSMDVCEQGGRASVGSIPKVNILYRSDHTDNIRFQAWKNLV